MAPKDLIRYKEVRVADRRNDQKSAAQIVNTDAASVTQEQFQEFILSQIKRIIYGDQPGTWKDDFQTQGIASLQDLIRMSLPQFFVADCLSTDAIGDPVIVTGPSVLTFPQVTRINIATTGLTKPAIGLIVTKATPTRCTVLTSGEFQFPTNTLIPGQPYWAAAAGGLTAVLPNPTPGTRLACQVIGTAIDSNRLLVHPERRPTIRVG
jgi:hypothetical protein